MNLKFFQNTQKNPSFFFIYPEMPYRTSLIHCLLGLLGSWSEHETSLYVNFYTYPGFIYMFKRLSSC